MAKNTGRGSRVAHALTPRGANGVPVFYAAKLVGGRLEPINRRLPWWRRLFARDEWNA